MLRLNMRTTQPMIGMHTQLGKLETHMTPAKLHTENQQARSNAHWTQPSLEIDTYPSSHSYGYTNHTDFAQQYGQQGISDVQSGISGFGVDRAHFRSPIVCRPAPLGVAGLIWLGAVSLCQWHGQCLQGRDCRSPLRFPAGNPGGRCIARPGPRQGSGVPVGGSASSLLFPRGVGAPGHHSTLCGLALFPQIGRAHV